MKKTFQQFEYEYRRSIERSLVLVLLFLIILLHLFPKNITLKKKELPPVPFTFTVEQIPITRQSVRRGRPPQKPVIPVPSEDEEIPMDATIEETIIKWNIGDSPFGNATYTSGRNDTIPARPIVQALPDYPRELQKENVRGIVKLMLLVDEHGRVREAVVVENKTGSEACSRAAKDAAKNNLYVPAKIGKKSVASWVACTYTFSPQ